VEGLSSGSGHDEGAPGLVMIKSNKQPEETESNEKHTALLQPSLSFSLSLSLLRLENEWRRRRRRSQDKIVLHLIHSFLTQKKCHKISFHDIFVSLIVPSSAFISL